MVEGREALARQKRLAKLILIFFLKMHLNLSKGHAKKKHLKKQDSILNRNLRY